MQKLFAVAAALVVLTGCAEVPPAPQYRSTMSPVSGYVDPATGKIVFNRASNRPGEVYLTGQTVTTVSPMVTGREDRAARFGQKPALPTFVSTNSPPTAAAE